MDRWEYYMISADIWGEIKFKDRTVETEDYINNLGKAGWELISVVKEKSDNRYSNDCIMVFKRKLKETEG